MTTAKIKNLVLIALASDEELLETLVLKGGNAISLLERGKKDTVSRASYDLDYSMEGDFDGDIEEYTARIERVLKSTFDENGLTVIDFAFTVRPSTISDTIKDFWGGYNIQFKLVNQADLEKYGSDLSELRKRAIKILPNQSPKVEVEISKYEYVGKKMEVEVEGFIIYIYSPEMIVFEKLRAICQQLPEYATVIPSHSPRPRARDFYDIYLINTLHKIDFDSEESKKTLEAIFNAKKVPLDFLHKIRENSAIHRSDWRNVIDTVSQKEDLKDFDFYLDYVNTLVNQITSP